MPALIRARRDLSLAGRPAPTVRPSSLRWLRDVLRLCVRRSQLRVTLPIALLVGAVVSLVNQGAMLLAGEIDVGMCAVCGLNFLAPFVALNVVLATATSGAWRRR